MEKIREIIKEDLAKVKNKAKGYWGENWDSYDRDELLSILLITIAENEKMARDNFQMRNEAFQEFAKLTK